MQIDTKATNLELTPQISDYISKKVDSLGRLLNQNDTSVRAFVEVGKTTQHHQSGDVFFAEINLYTAHGDFRARTEKDTLFAAIDIAKDDMASELGRNKKKKTSILRRSGARMKEALRGAYEYGKGSFRRFRR